MPITQSRMLSLIAAAEDYRQALLSLREQAFALARNVDEGAVTPQDALSGLLLELQGVEKRLKFPYETASTIADEKSHFRATSKANDSSRKRAERRRRRKGIIPKPTSREGLFVQPNPRTQPTEMQHLLNTSALEREAQAEADLIEAAQRARDTLPPEPTDADLDL